MNFRATISSEGPIKWPDGLGASLRERFPDREVLFLVLDEEGLVSRVLEISEKVSSLGIEPQNGPELYKQFAKLIEAEALLATRVGNMKATEIEIGTKLKTAFARAYLDLIDPEKEGGGLSATAAKAKASAICIEQEVAHREALAEFEAIKPVQEIVLSTKQYITKVLWDLNQQQRGN